MWCNFLPIPRYVFNISFIGVFNVKEGVYLTSWYLKLLPHLSFNRRRFSRQVTLRFITWASKKSSVGRSEFGKLWYQVVRRTACKIKWEPFKSQDKYLNELHYFYTHIQLKGWCTFLLVLIYCLFHVFTLRWRRLFCDSFFVTLSLTQ